MLNTMKRHIPSIITIVAMVLFIEFGLPGVYKAKAQQIGEQGRFVMIDHQQIISFADDGAGDYIRFRVFRDTQTGQEIVCMIGDTAADGRAPSCYLTGRKW
jgi:hypothetical protein